MADHEMTGTWKFVAQGNDRALLRAMNGDVDGALKDADAVRDKGLEMEPDPDLRREIECRRLEIRLNIAGVSKDVGVYGKFLQDIARCDLFDAERLRHILDLAGGELQSMRGDPA